MHMRAYMLLVIYLGCKNRTSWFNDALQQKTASIVNSIVQSNEVISAETNTVYAEIFVVINFRVFEIVMIFHNIRGVNFLRIRFQFISCTFITL